jgi:hypothetical protein
MGYSIGKRKEMRPIPRHNAIGNRRYVNGVPGQMPAGHSLRCAGCHKVALALQTPHAFDNPKHRATLSRAPHHPHQVRVHPGKAQFASCGNRHCRATPRIFSKVLNPPMPSMASTNSNR